MQQDKPTIKYFLYARKSTETEDKQVASIGDQMKELSKIAKQNKLDVVEEFKESMSAKAPGRPIFNEMMAKLKKGEANGILCWKLNRLARNPIDGGEISWLLQEGVVQNIQTYGRGYYPTDNVIVMAVELGMANQFIRDLREDTKRGLMGKAERGWYPTVASLGYKHNPEKRKGNKEIIKDPESFDLLRKTINLVLAKTHTVREALEIATDEWGLRNKFGKKPAISTFYRILNDTFYYGEFEYPKGSGNWHKGKHVPMITIGEYDKIQSMLGGKGKPRPKKREFAFTGLIKCGECGSGITAEDKIKRQKNGNIHYYTYYHCTKKKNRQCSQGCIRLEKLEEQIDEKLSQIEIPHDFTEWAMNAVKEENKTESKSRDRILSNQRKEYDTCLKKIDGLIDMRANQEIDEDDFSRRKEELTREKDRLQRLLKDTDKNVDDWLEQARAMFEFAEKAKTRFEIGTLKDKRLILSTIGSNLLLQDGILTIEANKVINHIKEMAPEVNKIYKRLEPLKNGSNKRKTGDLYSCNPTILPGSGSNRQPTGYT